MASNWKFEKCNKQHKFTEHREFLFVVFFHAHSVCLLHSGNHVASEYTALCRLYTMCDSHESEIRSPFAQINYCELRISKNCSQYTIHEFVKAPICEPSQTTTNQSADI